MGTREDSPDDIGAVIGGIAIVVTNVATVAAVVSLSFNYSYFAYVDPSLASLLTPQDLVMRSFPWLIPLSVAVLLSVRFGSWVAQKFLVRETELQSTRLAGSNNAWTFARVRWPAILFILTALAASLLDDPLYAPFGILLAVSALIFVELRKKKPTWFQDGKRATFCMSIVVAVVTASLLGLRNARDDLSIDSFEACYSDDSVSQHAHVMLAMEKGVLLRLPDRTTVEFKPWDAVKSLRVRAVAPSWHHLWQTQSPEKDPALICATPTSSATKP